MSETIDPHHQRPTLITVAMPADTNPRGDIFGGWLLSQMDLAGAVSANHRARGRVVTVGIEAISFHEPVVVGDEVTCYTQIERVGRTSIRVLVEAWRRRQDGDERVKVTDGVFTYVKLDAERRPVAVPEL